MIAHVGWFKDWTKGHIRYSSSQEGTATMGMGEPRDPSTDTSGMFYPQLSYPRLYYIRNSDNVPPPVWINPTKFKNNDPRRPLDPTELCRHFELSRKRDFTYARRPAPAWKPRTAVILRSNPRWRAGKWKAKT